MSICFSKRLLLLDERSDDFLKTLVYLGGYCTIEQAQKFGLANSARRVVARLEALKQSGFLKKRGANTRADEQEPDVRPAAPGERAGDREARIHQGRWW